MLEPRVRDDGPEQRLRLLHSVLPGTGVRVTIGSIGLDQSIGSPGDSDIDHVFHVKSVKGACD